MVVVSGGRGHLGRALACNRRFYFIMEANSGSQYTHSHRTSDKQQEFSTTQQQHHPWNSVPERRVLGELQVAPAAGGAGNSSSHKQPPMHSPLQPYAPPSPQATSGVRIAGMSPKAFPSPPPFTPPHAPPAVPATPFQQQLVHGTTGLIPVPPTPACDAATPAAASNMGQVQGSLWDPFTPWLKTSTKQPVGLTPATATATARPGHNNSQWGARIGQQQQQQQHEEEDLGEGVNHGGIPYTGGSATVSIPSPATVSPLSSAHSSLLQSAVGSAAVYRRNQQQQQQQAAGPHVGSNACSAQSLGPGGRWSTGVAQALPSPAAAAVPAGAPAQAATAGRAASCADLLARRLSFGPDSPSQKQQQQLEEEDVAEQSVSAVSVDGPGEPGAEAASPSLSEVLRRHLEGSLLVGSGAHSSGSEATTPASSGSACSSPGSSHSTPGSASSNGSSHVEEEAGVGALTLCGREGQVAPGTYPGLQHNSTSSGVGSTAAGNGRVPVAAPADSLPLGDRPAGMKGSPASAGASISSRSSKSSRSSLEDSDVEGDVVAPTTARRTMRWGGGNGATAAAPPASLLRRRVLLDEDDSDYATTSGASSSSHSRSRSRSRQHQVVQGQPRKAGTQQQQQQQRRRSRSQSKSRGGTSSRQAASGAAEAAGQPPWRQGQGRRVKGQAAQPRAHQAAASESEEDSEDTSGADAASGMTSSSSSAEDDWRTPQQQQQKRGKQVNGGPRGQQQHHQQDALPKGRQSLGAAGKGAAAGASSVQGGRGLLVGGQHWRTPPRQLQEGVHSGSRAAGGKGTPGRYTPLSPAPLLDMTNTPGSTAAAGKPAGGQQLRTPEAGVLSTMRTPPYTAQGSQLQGPAGGGGMGTPSAGRRSSGGSGGRAAGGVAVGAAHPVTVPRRRNTQFTRQRVELAQSLYSQWNAQVFGGRLPADLPLVWNPRLATTAGQVVDDGTRQHRKTGPGQRIPCRLELSPKVLDCESRLRSTLAHEMCHVAAWVVDREFEPHHGRAFKAWAARFQEAVASVDITTRHDYQVFRPFKWECTDPRCKKVYERNKQSIDPKRHACGLCKGSLRFLGKFSRDGTLAGSRKGAPNAYSTFVQSQFSAVKEKLPPGTPTQAVMRRLADVWREEKKRQEGPAPSPASSTGWVVAAGSVLGSMPAATAAAAAAAAVGGGAAVTPPSGRPRTAAAPSPVVLDLVSEEEGSEGMDSPIAGVAREQRLQQQLLPEEEEALPSLELLSIS